MIVLQIITYAFVIILGGILWHMGGQGKKWARIVAFPILIAAFKALLTLNIFTLFYWLALWILLAGFSYGITAPPHKFWVWVFGKGDDGKYLPVEIATRATCGLLWSLAGIVFALITGNWIGQIVYTIFAVIAVTLFGLIQKVEVSETGIGASVACSILI